MKKHIIKKQILDLTLDSQVGSFSFQSQVGAFYQREILPLIDEYCNAVADGDAVIRIDELEIDLGKIAKPDFERQFKRKFAQLLPQKITEALRMSSGRDVFTGENGLGDFTAADRDFAVLEFFIGEGCLPWWASGDASYEMPVLLQQNLTSRPERVKRLIAGITGNPVLLKRLIDQADDGNLLQIVALFQPEQVRAIEQVARALFTGLAACPILKDIGPSRLRTEVWRLLLAQAPASEGQLFNRQLTVANMVKQLASIWGVADSVLCDQLTKAGGEALFVPAPLERTAPGLAPDAAVDRKTMKAVENFIKKLHKAVAAIHKLTRTDGCIETVKYANQLETVEKLLIPLSTGPKEVTTSLARLTQIVDTATQLLESLLQGGEKAGSSLLAASDKRAEKLIAALCQLRDELAAIVAQNSGAAQHGPLYSSEDENIKAASRDGSKYAVSFSVAEKFDVGNAGLVLLWPYLSRFFAILGLASGGRFIDDAAAARAVLLLQYLATGTDRKSPGYELILNRIICGIALNAPLKPYLEITEAERTECENLLRAVILNWPALKNLSVSGLRGLFLRREGLIFTQDGQRVLRVAGTAYDVLVQQIPWGIGTVKLPWMDRLLLVEWE
jgi:hypothetical protein